MSGFSCTNTWKPSQAVVHGQVGADLALLAPRAEPLVEVHLLGEARVGGEDHRAAELLQVADDVLLVAREGAELGVDDVDLRSRSA